MIEQNVHARKEIIERKVTSSQSAVEFYWVLGIYTKTQNKSYLCDEVKKTYKKGIDWGKFRLLTIKMIFDN